MKRRREAPKTSPRSRRLRAQHFVFWAPERAAFSALRPASLFLFLALPSLLLSGYTPYTAPQPSSVFVCVPLFVYVCLWLSISVSSALALSARVTAERGTFVGVDYTWTTKLDACRGYTLTSYSVATRCVLERQAVIFEARINGVNVTSFTSLPVTAVAPKGTDCDNV